MIKIIAGPESGRQFTCGVETILGRAPHCAVPLSGEGISYEHAAITRIGDEFFIENLSANGTRLNDERLSGKARLRPRDRIRLGPGTVVRVESVPSAAGGGAARRWLLAVVVALLAVFAGVIVWNPLSETPSASHQARAYATLLKYAQDEVAARRLPPEALTYLQDAWRLETAGDRAGAKTMWVRLHVRLTSPDLQSRLQDLAERHPGALRRLQDPAPGAPPLDDDAKGAALLQFAGQMARNR